MSNIVNGLTYDQWCEQVDKLLPLPALDIVGDWLSMDSYLEGMSPMEGANEVWNQSMQDHDFPFRDLYEGE